MPPDGVNAIAPLFLPQVAFDTEGVAVTVEVVPMMIGDDVVSQPLASKTVTKYVPAGTLTMLFVVAPVLHL